MSTAQRFMRGQALAPRLEKRFSTKGRRQNRNLFPVGPRSEGVFSFLPSNSAGNPA